jgi:homospermidine synthase
LRGAGKPVAVLAHGANPGLVSHFVKQALLDMAFQQGGTPLSWAVSAAQTGLTPWALLAQALDVRVVQVAERDTQADELLSAHPANTPTFTSTWSPRGLLAELGQPAECSWGSHEAALPAGARLTDPAGARELYLPPARQKALQWVRSWVPSCGEHKALWVTHHEALSISGLLSMQVPGAEVGSATHYRPTCYYAYRPCAHTLRSIQAWQASGRSRPPQLETLTLSPMVQGFDELGVLLCSPGLSCWYGSTLHARDALGFLHHPSCGNATSVQVAAGILGALAWMMRNPLAGVVEAEDMDHCVVLAVARPMLGQVRGVLSPWHPGGELQWKDFLTNKPTPAKRKARFFFDDASWRIRSESVKSMPR